MCTIQDCITDFIDSLFTLITNKKRPARCGIIKKHTEKLHQLGDISFPATLHPWKNFLDEGSDKYILELPHEAAYTILQQTLPKCLELSNCIIKSQRFSLFLNRSNAINIGLRQSKSNCKYVRECLNTLTTQEKCFHDLTELRAQLVSEFYQTLKNVLKPEHNIWPDFLITSKSSDKEGAKTIFLCGPVVNIKTGCKETEVSTRDYLRSRQDEMTLIAKHKYGVRVSVESKWQEFLSHLGDSAVTFELLQVNPNNPVKINFNFPSSGSSKGAAFILYNCARLETLVRTFYEKVDAGVYPQLPPHDEIDFSLLTYEDEWSLAYNYILGFPSMLDSCLCLEGNINISPHYLCNFMSSMVKTFSQYYRKVRILTEPRAHLLPVLFARLHLIIALNETLKVCLSLLNINAVSQM